MNQIGIDCGQVFRLQQFVQQSPQVIDVDARLLICRFDNLFKGQRDMFGSSFIERQMHQVGMATNRFAEGFEYSAPAPAGYTAVPNPEFQSA